MSRSILDLTQQLVTGCKVLEQFGIFDEQGHLSSRTAPDSRSMLINGNVSPGRANVQDFAEVELDEEERPEGIPSETPIHEQIYEARPEVQAICHNHSPYAVIAASVGLEMRPVHQIGAIQRAPVEVYDDYDLEGGTLVTTDEEAAKLAAQLGEDRAIVMKGHGAVVVGESITETVLASIKLEYNARLLYQQSVVGEPWYLPQELVDQCIEFVYQENKLEKSIDYYLSQTTDC